MLFAFSAIVVVSFVFWGACFVVVNWQEKSTKMKREKEKRRIGLLGFNDMPFNLKRRGRFAICCPYFFGNTSLR